MAKRRSESRKAKAGDTVRPKIPFAVKQQVLVEAGYKCARPVCHNVIALDLHHVIYVGDGGGNEASNLLPLCGYCHDMHHREHFPSEAIRVWKGLLVALNHAFDRRSMDLLLYLRMQPEFAYYSGDGVLQFAGLIAAGLVGFGAGGAAPVDQFGAVKASSHQLRLTDKGERLVDAWMAGDEAKYREALANS
jgi:hypothetical protein